MTYKIFRSFLTWCFFTKQLQKEGFTNIDALDASQEMLNVASKKDIYKELICAFVEKDQALAIENIKPFKYLPHCREYSRFSFLNERASLARWQDTFEDCYLGFHAYDSACIVHCSVIFLSRHHNIVSKHAQNPI